MKLTAWIVLIVPALLIGACKENNQENSSTVIDKEENTVDAVSLELAWETDTTMLTCESVLYDKENEIIYVANINNNPWEKDGNGFLSIIDTEGNVLEEKWVTGISGPKGMGIANGKLYVNDIDEMVEIDIASKEIVNRYKVEGDPALNDITIDQEGGVYASGSNSNAIYKLQDGKLETIIESDFGRLNGLLHMDGGLYFASSASSEFGHYDLEKKSRDIIVDRIGHGDGIVTLGDGQFIVSSWKGEVFYVNAKEKTKKMLIEADERALNAADIDYIPSQHLLLVPTFFGNKVMAYKVSLGK